MSDETIYIKYNSFTMKENILRKLINEIIDSKGDIIGQEDMPLNDGNMDSMANTSTDKAQLIGRQNYRNSYNSILGFSVMEQNAEENNVIEEDKLSPKQDDKLAEKSTKDNEIVDNKLNKVAELLNKKFDKEELNKLITLLEKNK